MNKDKIWSVCDEEKYVDHRIIPLLDSKKIDKQTLELSFKKPADFHNQQGQYTILKLTNPKVTQLDLSYRWLPVVSASEEESIRFHIELDGSSFSKSCEQLNKEDEALVFGPMA